jgi:predicted MFS family arabinose efflux permease
VANGVNGLAIGMIGPFMSYWLSRRYDVGPAPIGLLFALINLGSLASTLAAAGVGRRMGTVRTIAVVRAIGGVLLVPMVLAPSFWLAGAIYFVRMLAQRVGLPLRQSFVQDLAHPDERASMAALSNVPAQATMAGSQALAGYLFDEVSLAAPFELAAVFQCLNAVLYAVLFAWMPPRPVAARMLAKLPAVNARMRKSDILNIGSATLVSTTAKETRSATPRLRQVSTSGLPHPMVLCP